MWCWCMDLRRLEKKDYDEQEKWNRSRLIKKRSVCVELYLMLQRELYCTVTGVSFFFVFCNPLEDKQKKTEFCGEMKCFYACFWHLQRESSKGIFYIQIFFFENILLVGAFISIINSFFKYSNNNEKIWRTIQRRCLYQLSKKIRLKQQQNEFGNDLTFTFTRCSQRLSKRNFIFRSRSSRNQYLLDEKGASLSLAINVFTYFTCWFIIIFNTRSEHQLFFIINEYVSVCVCASVCKKNYYLRGVTSNFIFPGIIFNIV